MTRRPPPIALGRPIDPSYPSNRTALAVAAVAGVVGAVVALVRGDGWVDVLVGVGVAAGSSLLAWATARELDHDRPGGATVAGVAAPLVALTVGEPAFLAGVALLMAARVALRSTGATPSWFELAALGGLAVIAAGPTGGWVAAMVLAVAISREGSRPAGAVGWGRLIGGVSAVVATARHLGWGDGFVIGGDQLAWAVVAAAVGVAALLLLPRDVPRAPCDHTELPPRGPDQFAARLLAVLGAAVATVVAADPAFAAPTILAAVGVAAWARLAPPAR